MSAATSTPVRMRALIYARVSLDLAEGRSVAEQETECRAWADREGWHVAAVITETGSASRYARSTHARTKWPELVHALATGDYDILLTWEHSRATRQLDEYAQLRTLCARHGVLWGYSGTVYDLTQRDARFRTGLDALLSEDESARTSERVQRAVRARAQAGAPHGKLPYGYRREYDPATGRLLRQVPDDTQAPIVREIYERVLAGDGVRTIATDLSDRDVTPPRPPTSRHDRTQAWLGITVRRIALSPTYAGKRTHRGVIVGDATWEPLVTVETWERAVAVLTDPARATRTGDSIARHLLSGIARCGKPGPDGTECGGELRHLVNRGRYPTYICFTRGCYGVAIAARMLDDYVNDVVLGLLTAQGEQLRAAAIGDAAHDGAATTRAHLQGLRERLAGFVTAAAAGDLSPATLAAIEADLSPQIAAAEADLRRQLVPRALRRLAGPDPVAAWTAMAVQDQRAILRDLLRVVVLPAGKGNWGRRGLDETRVRLTPLW